MNYQLLTITFALVAHWFTPCASGQPPSRLRANPELEMRRIQLTNVYLILMSIDRAEENLKVFGETKIEQIRGKIPGWQEEVRKGRERLDEFSQLFKRDKLLLSHAQLILAEARRLEKIDLNVGINYATSEDAVLLRVKKIDDYIDSINRVPEGSETKK